MHVHMVTTDAFHVNYKARQSIFCTARIQCLEMTALTMQMFNNASIQRLVMPIYKSLEHVHYTCFPWYVHCTVPTLQQCHACI